MAAPPSRAGREAILQECDEEEMRESHVWELTRFHQLRNPRSGLCLDASADNGSGSFVMVCLVLVCCQRLTRVSVS